MQNSKITIYFDFSCYRRAFKLFYQLIPLLRFDEISFSVRVIHPGHSFRHLRDMEQIVRFKFDTELST